MKLYRLKDECMATDILKRHGFVCATPDIGLVSEQIWQKDGKQYKFTGWENNPKTALMAENPKYIEVEQVQMTTKYKCKRCGKVVAIKLPNCPECSSCDGYDKMETITRINGNKQRYETGLPRLVIQGFINDTALAHIEENTSLHFKETAWKGNYEVYPTSSNQITALFLTYNYKTRYYNNGSIKNTLFLKSDHHIGFDVGAICFDCCEYNHIHTNGLKKGDMLSC